LYDKYIIFVFGWAARSRNGFGDQFSYRCMELSGRMCKANGLRSPPGVESAASEQSSDVVLQYQLRPRVEDINPAVDHGPVAL
jgi:hypothetical protein